MGSVIRSLVVKVGADITDFQKQMTAAAKHMEKAGKDWKKAGETMTKNVTIPILAAGTAMVALAIKAGAYAEQISIASQTTGMSVKKLQELKYVSSQVDVEFETLVGSFSKFTKTLVSARNPTSEQARAFNQLGINLKNVDGSLKPLNEVYFETIRKLGQMTDETLQAQTASILFGRSFQDLIPLINTSSEDLEKLSKQANVFKLVRTDEEIKKLAAFDDKIAEIKLRFEGAGQTISLKFLPVLDKLVSTLDSKVFPAVERVTDAIVKMADKFGSMSSQKQDAWLIGIGSAIAIGPITKVVGSLLKTFGSITLAAKGLVTAITGIFKGSGAAFATAATQGTGLLGAIGKIVTMLPELLIVAATIAEMAYIIKSGVFNMTAIGNLPENIKKMNEGKSWWERTPLGVVSDPYKKANEKYKYGPDLINPNDAAREKAMGEYVPTQIKKTGSAVDPMAFIRQSLAISPAAAAQNIADLKRAKDWEKALSAYTDKSKKATTEADKFKDSILAMVDAIKAQTKAFFNFANIFDVVDNKIVSGDRLFIRLQKRIKAMMDWRSNLAILEKRGVSKENINELRGMGPSASGEIAGLTQLSSAKLKEYFAGVNKIQGIAGGEASKFVTTAEQIGTKIEKQINIYATGAKGDAVTIADAIVKKLRVAGYRI